MLPAATLLLVLMGLAGGGTAAQASPLPAADSMPENRAPAIVFEEDFENTIDGDNILLSEYRGAAGETYTADPYWIDRVQCNGFIVDETSSASAGDCTGHPGTSATAF